jgi:hypothetical protein
LLFLLPQLRNIVLASFQSIASLSISRLLKFRSRLLSIRVISSTPVNIPRSGEKPSGGLLADSKWAIPSLDVVKARKAPGLHGTLQCGNRSEGGN